MSQKKFHKVFNLGFSKTGTTSIEQALSILGYRVAKGHWKYNYCFYLFALCVNRDYDEIIRFTHSFDAFCDAPWGGGTDLYKRLIVEFPKARFLLSVRDSEKWYRSLHNQLTIFDRNDMTALSSYQQNGMWGSAYWFRHIFGITKLNGQKQHIIDTYNQYNEEVARYFKSNGIPLLIIDIGEGDPWNKICPFLGEEKPDRPFPKVNVTPTDWVENRNRVQRAVAAALDLDSPLGGGGELL